MSDKKNAEQSEIIKDGKSSGLLLHQEENQETTSSQSQSKSSAQDNIGIDSSVIHTKSEIALEKGTKNIKSESGSNKSDDSDENRNLTCSKGEKISMETLEFDEAESHEEASIKQKETLSINGEREEIGDHKEDLSLTQSKADEASVEGITHDPDEKEELQHGDEAESTDNKFKKEDINKEDKVALRSDTEKKSEPQIESETSVEADKETSVSKPLTIEEKRKQERENKMTIEEKRKLQQSQSNLPSQRVSIKDYFRHSDQWDRIFLIVLLLCEVMNIYISLQVLRYIRSIYAMSIFLVLTLLIMVIFWIMMKKKRIGYCCSGGLTLLLVIGSYGAYRLAVFSSQVFNNIETETVMIVTAKDSKLTRAYDFTNRKMAMVEYDEELNGFAREILQEEEKSGYQEINYSSYKEAYMDMQEGKIDLMVYDAQIQKTLEEDKIDSEAHIKVLFEKTFEREAVKSKAVDISKDPFNVFISGVDLTSRGINEKGSSDVNIILTVNPQTKKMIMQTIPRDSWVPVTCMNDRHTKLTYAGSYGGIDCSIQTIEEEYGITINYYAKINFQGVIDLVDALGGIMVNSDVGFCESHPFEGYGVRDYCYYAGENYVNGIEALMFSRIRRVFSDGDIERGRHQMALVEGVMNKFLEEPTMEHINGLLLAVQNNFTTNLEENDMGKALELFLKMQDQINSIDTFTMKGELIWINDEISGEYLYYFYPHDGEIVKFQQRIHDVMEGK